MMSLRNLVSLACILAACSFASGQNWHTSGAPLGSGGSSLDFSGNIFIDTGIGLSSLPRATDRTPGTGTTGEYTISMWLQSDDNRASGGQTWFMGQTSRGLHLGLRNGGHLEQAHWSQDHAGETEVPLYDGTSQATDDASWFHVAYTYNPSRTTPDATLLSPAGDAEDGEARVYLNGVFDGWDGEGSSPAGKQHINQLGNIILAARDSDINGAWDGRIDDVAFWDAELSPAEIATLAAGTLPSALETPAGLFFDFNEGSGTVANGVGAGVWDAGANHSFFVPAPLPPQPVGPGNWNARVIGIDTDMTGGGDGDINNTTEARDILAYAGPHVGRNATNPDEALNLNDWNILEDYFESRNFVDFTWRNTDGTTPQDTFDTDHQYPGAPYEHGGDDPNVPNFNGQDFLVHVTTEEPLNFAPGTYSINFGSDDGGDLRIVPTDGSEFTFDAEPVGSDEIVDDRILREGTRIHAQTCGEFTVGEDGLSAHIDSLMFQRAGFATFEVSIAAGPCTPHGNGYFELLGSDNLRNDEDTGFLVTTGTPVSNGSTRAGLDCDLDGDGDCDQEDINALFATDPTAEDINTWLTQASDADNTALGSETDVLVVGDADLSGEVNSADLGLLLNNFGSDTNTWVGGDLNASGNVDSVDLGLLLNNFNFQSPATAAVPEPNSLSLIGLGVLMGLFARRRR